MAATIAISARLLGVATRRILATMAAATAIKASSDVMVVILLVAVRSTVGCGQVAARIGAEAAARNPPGYDGIVGMALLGRCLLLVLVAIYWEWEGALLVVTLSWRPVRQYWRKNNNDSNMTHCNSNM